MRRKEPFLLILLRASTAVSRVFVNYYGLKCCARESCARTFRPPKRPWFGTECTCTLGVHACMPSNTPPQQEQLLGRAGKGIFCIPISCSTLVLRCWLRRSRVTQAAFATTGTKSVDSFTDVSNHGCSDFDPDFSREVVCCLSSPQKTLTDFSGRAKGKGFPQFSDFSEATCFLENKAHTCSFSRCLCSGVFLLNRVLHG